MPNIQSAKKRCKVISAKTMQNKIQKSVLRTNLKKLQAEVKENPAALKTAYKVLDKAVAKGILHKNNAARKKAQIAAMAK